MSVATDLLAHIIECAVAVGLVRTGEGSTHARQSMEGAVLEKPNEGALYRRRSIEHLAGTNI